MNKSLIYEAFGQPHQVLKIKESCKPSLQDHEILVKMIYAPVNPSDLIPIKGAYAHRIKLPSVAGYEGVGRIIEVGDALSQKLIGQHVLPLHGEGTWQFFVKCPIDHAYFIPESFDLLSASQLYINPLTALLLCTEVLRLEPGEKLAINAAASSIGQVFAQLSKVMGFDLVAITRDRKKHEKLRLLGAREVRTDLNSLEVDAAIDCVGGQAGNDLAACVRPGGKFQALGLLSGKQVDWAKISSLPIETGIFHLRHWYTKLSVQEWQEKMQMLEQLVTNKHLVINQEITLVPFDKLVTKLDKPSKSKLIVDFTQK